MWCGVLVCVEGDLDSYGLWITFLASTIMEVCSEGATPIAADIFRRAHAIGNSFAFLMAGVSTNYTTVMVLKQATKSWKIALFMPLISIISGLQQQG